MTNKIEQIIGCQIGEICTGLPRPVPETEDIEGARKLLTALDAAGLKVVPKFTSEDRVAESLPWEMESWSEVVDGAHLVNSVIGNFDPSTYEPEPTEQTKCSFPDCGCAEARLCMFPPANDGAMAWNLPKRKEPNQ